MRHRTAHAAALALASALMAGCAQVPPAAEAAPQPNHSLFGTDATVTSSTPDRVLRYAEHPRAIAELRLPTGEGPFPLAVIFHGGCWKTGIASQAYMAPLATRWQQLGIATLNVDYREVGDGGGWPGSFEDWQSAARLIDTVSADHSIDRARVTLVGHSAGALPAQWLAAAQGTDGPLGARAPLDVRAAIVLDGPADVGAERGAFDALCQCSAVDPFMGGTPADLPARYTALAPSTQAPRLQEILFVQAKLPPPPESALAALRGGGARVTVREKPDVSHFAVITPGNPAYDASEAAMVAVLKGE